jgi:tetratricopeptide (TPR) repeat protein
MNDKILRFEYLIKKNPLKAVHLIKKAIADEPQNYEYLLALGLYLAKEERDSEAVKYLEKAKKITDLDASASFTLALSYMRNEDYRLAIRAFKDTGEIYPESIYNTAICYLNLGEADKAVIEARKLQDNEKLGQSALKLIIDILLFTEQFKEEAIELALYEKRYGQDTYFHYVKGNHSYMRGNYLASAYHLSKISWDEVAPNVFLRKLAHSYRAIKQYNKALDCYKAMENLDLSPSLYVLNYLDTLYILGEYEEVIKLAEKYEKDFTNKDTLKNVKAKAYYKLNLE